MKTGVLVVDDSALMRKLLSDILNSDPDIEVLGIAADGKEALEKIEKLNPEVVTMDIQMPIMDGMTALKKIMESSPRPVVMVTAINDSSLTVDALGAGAVDFIIKPADRITLDDSKWKAEVLQKIKTAATAKLKKLSLKKVIRHDFFGAVNKIIVIGSSTGGPQTLEQIIPALPKNIPACVLIVQHMPAGFTQSFAERLNHISELEVKEAKEGDEIREGLAYIAPGDFHMEIKRIRGGVLANDVITLNQKDKEQGVRPCANVMMRSVVELYGEKTIGLILTGMGADGTEGARAIKKRGGTVIVQDEKSSIIYGMPKSVVEAGYYDEIVELSKIPVALIQLLEL